MDSRDDSAATLSKDSQKSTRSSNVSDQEENEEILGCKPSRRICSLPLDTTIESVIQLGQSTTSIKEQERSKKFKRIRNASLNSTVDTTPPVKVAEEERRRSRSVSLGNDVEKTPIQLNISGSSEALESEPAKKVMYIF